ncbi:MAG: Na/Pi cotransporter family protein [Bacteroidales bacterium]|nr:Na/Pi cotransporter family protein [Candidatus Latescibacterota bacterium]
MNIDYVKIFIGAVGGLGLFLVGMKLMSEGMQTVAGERLRKLINAITDNRLVACGVGATVTSLIQSSSVTTVMIVGMVNAGIMTLRQAIGVILGADIGTTITAWLVALKIVEYGLPILGISAFFYLFSKNERVRYIAMMTLGLGMVFFGLEIMKEGFMPLRDNPEFISLLSRFEPKSMVGVIKCVLVGALVTAIIQSSSATVAITITLARTGVIGYETAVALVLGENIGTTITAFLASLGAITNAKRTAYAHILIKIIGVMIMVPFFFRYIWLLKFIIPENAAIATRIAFAHTGFNIFIVSLFMPLINPFTRFVKFLVPAKDHKEKHHLTYLDVRIYDTPAIGIQQSYSEIILMGEGVQKMMGWLRSSLKDLNGDRTLEKKLFHREKIFDLIQKEIVEFIGKMMTGTLSHDVTKEVHKQLRIADEFESISDYIVIILKLRCRMRNEGLTFAEKDVEEILQLHDLVSEYTQLIHEAVETRDEGAITKALSQGDTIAHQVKNFRANHLLRLENKETEPLASLIIMDMLSSYRRIKDHALNIAEVVAGEK